jgi:hypothetical protein
VEGARVPMADALLPRRGRIDGFEGDGNLDQLLAAVDGVGGHSVEKY